jgi:hypothetical protein
MIRLRRWLAEAFEPAISGAWDGGAGTAQRSRRRREQRNRQQREQRRQLGGRFMARIDDHGRICLHDNFGGFWRSLAEFTPWQAVQIGLDLIGLALAERTSELGLIETEL